MKNRTVPKIDDPITWVSRSAGRLITTSWNVMYENIFPDDHENITWCRGHVEADSLEGKALIVAAALARDT